VVRAHREFFQKDEHGLIAQHHTWGSLTTDPANPAYQQYMIDLVTHDLREYDIDGYRVDANTFKAPSWDPAVAYPAWKGANTFELQARMYAAMRQVKPDVVILSEIFGPVWHALCNLVHDSANWASSVALEQMESGTMTAASYKQLMANTYDCLPAGANRVYFGRNHDTSWFGNFGGYTPRFMALDAIHCLMAVPELFAGDPRNGPSPDDDPATFGYYRKILALRRAQPELARGDTLLHDVECDNAWVFTGARRLGDTTTLVAVSLSAKPESARIRWRVTQPVRPGPTRVADPIGGRVLSLTPAGGEWRLQFEPFQVWVGTP
jgi:glycosidase